MTKLIGQGMDGERIEIDDADFTPKTATLTRAEKKMILTAVLEGVWGDTVEVWCDDECTICGDIHSEDNCPKVAEARKEQP